MAMSNGHPTPPSASKQPKPQCLFPPCVRRVKEEDTVVCPIHKEMAEYLLWIFEYIGYGDVPIAIALKVVSAQINKGGTSPTKGPGADIIGLDGKKLI
ncbi:hypothetical protein LCGC14_1259250 [marine sediment metagenome]|uniref:Uncharacterized protein n=1 Tax=marine sediment metagenome TaxID=412755 RepID=A0A0F9P4K9_9ZZZZ